MISKEQFDFLSNRKVLGAVKVAQECLHFIKSKKSQSFILKMDMINAYDRMEWCYLKFVLIHIGLLAKYTN